MNAIIINSEEEKIIKHKKYEVIYTKDLYNTITDSYNLSSLEKYKTLLILQKDYKVNMEIFDLVNGDVSLSSCYVDFFIDNYTTSSNCLDGEILITNHKNLEKLKKVDDNPEEKYKLFLKLNKEFITPLPLGLRSLITPLI